MRRREFVGLIGGAAASALWQPAASARQPGRVARVGFIHEHDDGGDAARLFTLGMEKVGWAVGRNLTIDYRWGVNDAEKAQQASQEILKLGPDVIVSSGSPATKALKQATQTV